MEEMKTMDEMAPGTATVPEMIPACVPAQRDDWSVELCRQLTQEAARQAGQTPPLLMFLGDSITQQWTAAKDDPNPGGLDVWNAHFQPLGAVNFGVSGDRTEHVLWRITEGQQLRGCPRVVVLLIGTNNLHREQTPDSAWEVLAGIKLIVDTIRKKSPGTRTLLLGILPRAWDAATAMPKIKEVNRQLAGLADGRTVFNLDVSSRFLDKAGAAAFEMMPDGIHLSPHAYDVLAQAILPKLREIISTSWPGREIFVTTTEKRLSCTQAGRQSSNKSPAT